MSQSPGLALLTTVADAESYFGGACAIAPTPKRSFSPQITAFQRLQHGEKRYFPFERVRRKDPDQRQVFRRHLLGHQRRVLRSSLLEHLLVVWCAELSKDGLVKTLQILSFFQQHPWKTPKILFPDDKPREPRAPREQELRIDVRPVHADLPPPSSTEPSKPRRVYIRNYFELAQMLPSVYESGMHTTECRVNPLVQNQT